MIDRMKKRARKYFIPHQENDFRPHLLRAGGLLVVAVFVFGALFASNIQRFILRTSDYIASVLPAVLVDLANKDRSEQKLAYLKINPKLEAAARLKAKDMAEKGYFAHYSPEGVSPWHWIKESDYNFIYAGENLAVNFDDSGAVNTAWMASPGHRANILNDKFTEIGIASQKGYYNGRETTFVVQMFGAPAKTEVAVLPKPTPVPVKSESALVAISNVSQNFNVLGESEENLAKQIFIAVKDTSAESEVMPANTVQTAYSGSVAKFVSSPTKVLGLLYALLAILLFTMLYFALKTKHQYKIRHTSLIVLMLLIIFSIFSLYQTRVQQNVLLPQTQKISL